MDRRKFMKFLGVGTLAAPAVVTAAGDFRTEIKRLAKREELFDKSLAAMNAMNEIVEEPANQRTYKQLLLRKPPYEEFERILAELDEIHRRAGV